MSQNDTNIETESPIDDTYEKLKSHIDMVLGKSDDFEFDPSPTPNCREIRDAYDAVKLGLNYAVIRSGWPRGNVIPYVIYMVNYNDTFYIVPYSNFDQIYDIDIYSP